MQPMTRIMDGKTPFATLPCRCKELIRLAMYKLACSLYKPKHFAFHKNGFFLEDLFQHRFTALKTLYEYRSMAKEGVQVRVCALFSYQGKKNYLGGNGTTICSGDIVSAEFYLGGNPGEFCFEGNIPNILPSKLLLSWCKKNGPGVITALN